MSVPSDPQDESVDLTNEDAVAVGKADMRRGFLWLGGASAVARVVDTLSVLVIMWSTTREQLGLATLAWSIAVFLEAMSGLGIGTALLQAREVGKERLASAFWYTMGLAVGLVVIISSASPLLARWFGEPALAPLIAISSLKLPLVGLAMIPLTLLNRRTRFKHIAAVQTGATLFGSVVTCTLVVLGFDAWGLVIGQTSHGLATAVLSNYLCPYRPEGRFDRVLSRADISFGLKITGSGMLYHFYRNADYYLIGRILGVGAVGVYRVAFDLAMTPTMAVLNVVGRSALPVYARLNDRPEKVREAFLWTLRSLSILLAPVTAILFFAAEDVLSFIDGGKWSDAAPMVRWLSGAALLRCIAQTFPQVFQAMRRPALAFYDSVLMTVLVVVTMSLFLMSYGHGRGAVVAAWSWNLTYPLELAVLVAMVRPLIGLRWSDPLRAVQHCVYMLLAMGAAHALLATLLPAHVAGYRPAAEVACVLAVYAAYLRFILNIKLTGTLQRGTSDE
jgi:O-antigen/teichoic acid export membrane protein